MKEHASFCPAVDAEKKGFYFYLQQVFSFKKKDSTYPFKQSLKQLVYRIWHMVSDLFSISNENLKILVRIIRDCKKKGEKTPRASNESDEFVVLTE